jgi:uridine kinase
VLAQALNSDKPVFILAAGGSCAGKGVYVAEMLRRAGRLKGKSVFAMKMDDCFLDIDDPKLPRLDGAPTFDVPGAYHLSEFRGYVQAIKDGQRVHYPCYDMGNNKRLTSSTQLVIPADVFIIDGLFAISALGEFDWSGANVIRVYIDARPQVRLGRRLRRNIAAPR